MYQVYCDDCLNKLKDIPDKSIDLVLIDPPYNIGKDKKWDKWKTVDSYVEFMGSVFLECQRVLKDNGSFYFFHNDFLQIVELQNWINKNTGFIFNSFIVWDKGDFRAISWKNPSEKNNLRSWFNACEYCLYYTMQDKYIDKKLYIECVRNIQDYIKNLIYKYGGNVTKANEFYCEYSGKTGNYRSLFFGKCQPVLYTEQQYNGLCKYIKSLGCEESLKTYNEVLEMCDRDKYEELRYTHNLDANHKNVWISKEKNNGKLHSCQKPLDILERIIKTSSNEGDVVLDCFMGSGSTGVACQNTNRRFIGIEKEEKYFEIAKKRLEENGGLKYGN